MTRYDYAQVENSRTTFAMFDDKPDTIERLERIWKGEGFGTEFFNDRIELGELIDRLMDPSFAPLGLIPTFDIKFDHPFQFYAGREHYRIKEPRLAGVEIVEFLTQTFGTLKGTKFILMSSAEPEREVERRIDDLQQHGIDVQFVSKNDAEDSVLEKTYRLLDKNGKLSLFGHLKVFESFCDVLEIDKAERAKMLGAEDTTELFYAKHIRNYVESSRSAKGRISNFLSIELILRDLFSSEEIAGKVREITLSDGRSLLCAIVSGREIDQRRALAYLEHSLGAHA